VEQVRIPKLLKIKAGRSHITQDIMHKVSLKVNSLLNTGVIK